MKILSVLAIFYFICLPVQSESLSILDYEERVWNGMNQYKAKNFEKAYKTFDKMSKWGDKYSQYFLGNMYISGQYVTQDLIEGAAWLSLAGEAKDEWKESADQIFNILTDDEKAEVNVLISKYKKLYGMTTQKISCFRKARTGTRLKAWGCTKQRGTYAGNTIL
ncbi:MAG: hypothetical protein COA86_15335 [Kangiella sp.]|nr:MAG: hypothetical protein COA86_15335 [Kangiella sp.]